ncbi:MAG: phospholipid methyltransferase [Bacteroidetes bacterium]|nr:phospholipid methyltransferase [Bacteroidota bacterium]
MNKTQFLKRFLKERKAIGAMMPSSKFLTKKMFDKVCFKEIRTIVELGPGTGVFTEEIISKMNKNTRFLVIELDDVFHELLYEKIKHPNVEIVKASATKLRELLADRNIESVDLIISSLPLANFSSSLKLLILLSCKNSLTKTSGQFVQFQYTPQLHRLFKRVFTSVVLDFTLLNVPPAFVYSCRNN